MSSEKCITNMFNSNKFYDVVKIRDHKTNKNKILDKIDSYEEHSFNDISHTDWQPYVAETI